MTLETAKQLKEAGWDEETELYFNLPYGEQTFLRMQVNPRHKDVISCPSLEELLAVMPTVYRGGKKDHCLHLRKLNGYLAFYGDELFGMGSDPSEAVAQLWLQLRKEGIV